MQEEVGAVKAFSIDYDTLHGLIYAEANTFSLCIASYILDDLHCDIGGSLVTDVETM